jgi:CBS domain-containing protein
LHELAHSFVASKYGVTIKKIVLLPFGGVAMMEKLPKNPRHELKIAIAGPCLNFWIAFAMLILLFAFPSAIDKIFPFFVIEFGLNAVDLIILILKVNLLLGVFNLFIPALPMDGGRVLRALMALKVGFPAATEIATGIAKSIAVLMLVFGLLIFNLWLAIIAFFIYIGATQESAAVRFSSLFEGVKIKDMMSKHVVTVSGDLTLEEFSDIILKYRHMGYPILEGDKLVGIITFADLANIEKESWKATKVRDVMSRDILVASPDEDIMEVLEKMISRNVGRVPVVEEGRLVGIVSKTDIVRASQVMKLMK